MSDDFRKQLYRNFNQRATDELIEIWQTNNRAEWSELSFDVIQEILQERLSALPSQNEPITELVNEEKLKEQNERLKFNWMLPIWGAIGFGIGFALVGGIMLTIYHHSTISFAHVFSKKVDLNVIVLDAVRGIFVGCVGGAGLGLALKDRSRIFYLSLAGAIGFGWAFALAVASDDIVSDIGQAILQLTRKESYDTTLAYGYGMGTVVGGIGGLVLGLALPKYRAIASFLLSVAGIFSFGFAFAGGYLLMDGRFFSSWDALVRRTYFIYYLYDYDFFCPWNAWGGIVGGISLGIALALYYKILGYIQQWQS